MKKLHAIAFIASILALAFKSDIHTYRISRIKNLKTGDTSDFRYNSDGKIADAISSHGARLTYYYTGDIIIKKVSDIKSGMYSTDTVFLNKQGLAYRIAQNVSCGAISNNYGYSKDKFLIRDETYDKGILQGVKTWSVSDNCQQSEIFFRDSKPRNTTWYFYYPDTDNTISEENMGRPYSGKSAQQLIKEKFTINIEGDTTIHIFYRYQFDNLHRVKLSVMHDKSGAVADSTEYTY